jgi:hypothetical protein
LVAAAGGGAIAAPAAARAGASLLTALAAAAVWLGVGAASPAPSGAAHQQPWWRVMSATCPVLLPW